MTAGKDCFHPYCTEDNCGVGRLHPTEHQKGLLALVVEGTWQKTGTATSVSSVMAGTVDMNRSSLENSLALLTHGYTP